MNNRKIFVFFIIFLTILFTDNYFHIDENILKWVLLVDLILIVCGTFFILYKFYSCKKDDTKNFFDVLFLTVFFVLIFVPCICLDKNEYLFFEKRFLSKLPHIYSRETGINYEYGMDLESFIKDRFFLRSNCIYIYYKFLFNLNDIIFANYEVYNKKTNRFFQEFRPSKFRINKYFEPKIIENFNLLNKFCKNNDIELYILLVPDRTEMKENFEPYNLDKINSETRTIIYDIQSKSDADIIYPLKEIEQEALINPVYFKTDLHWTDSGAYVGYKVLIKEIKKKFPQIKIVEKEDYNLEKSKLVRSGWWQTYHNGLSLEEMFPFYKDRAKEILDTEYLYFEHKNKELLETTVIDESNNKYKEFYYPYGADLKVVLLGTSMNENLTSFIPYTFKNVKYFRINDIKDQKESEDFKIMKLYSKRILDYKPDIVIFSIYTGNLFHIDKMFDFN